MKPEFHTLIEGYTELKSAYQHFLTLRDACNDAINLAETTPIFRFDMLKIKKLNRKIKLLEKKYPIATNFIANPKKDQGIDFDPVIKGYTALKQAYAKEDALIQEWMVYTSDEESYNEYNEAYSAENAQLEQTIKNLEILYPVAKVFIKRPVLVLAQLDLMLDPAIAGYSELKKLYQERTALLKSYNNARVSVFFDPLFPFDTRAFIDAERTVLQLEAKYPIAQAFFDDQSELTLGEAALDALMSGYLEIKESLEGYHGFDEDEEDAAVYQEREEREMRERAALQKKYPIASAYIRRFYDELIIFDPDGTGETKKTAVFFPLDRDFVMHCSVFAPTRDGMSDRREYS